MRKLVLIPAIILICMSLIRIPTSAESAIFRKTGISQKKIALTFDDGPHPVQTPEILKILREYHVHATFFVIGVNVRNYPDKIPEILSDGHEIGNHTFSHKCLANESIYQVSQELFQCEKAIYETGEYRPKLFRPPGGIIDETVKRFCEEWDYSVILWSIDTRDWSHRSPEEITKEILTSVRPGDIILMHDYIGGYTPTATVLRSIIPELRRMGYEFCTVSELIETKS